MKDLTTAIWGQLLGSDLSDRISSRLYKGQVPDGASYPYAVYSISSITSNRNFTEHYKDVIVQFSLFSSASGTTEIENCYTDLKTLYDEKQFIVTGSTLVWMRRISAAFIVEDHVTPTGTVRVWAYHVDFEVLTSLD